MPQSIPLPGWLLKRAREAEFLRVHTLLAPAAPRSSAVYLLEGSSLFELHAVDDAEQGIDGVTIPLTRREATTMLQNFAGSMGGRIPGAPVRTLPPLPVEDVKA